MVAQRASGLVVQEAEAIDQWGPDIRSSKARRRKPGQGGRMVWQRLPSSKQDEGPRGSASEVRGIMQHDLRCLVTDARFRRCYGSHCYSASSYARIVCCWRVLGLEATEGTVRANDTDFWRRLCCSRPETGMLNYGIARFGPAGKGTGNFPRQNRQLYWGWEGAGVCLRESALGMRLSSESANLQQNAVNASKRHSPTSAAASCESKQMLRQLRQ